MTISVRAVTAPAVDSSSPYNVAKPTGTLQGDLMIASVVVSTDSPDQVLPPAGWYAVRGGGINGIDNISLWYKVAGASEPSSYDFTSLTSAIVGVGIISFYGSGAIRIDDVASQVNASGNRICPSVDFTAAGMMACFVACASSVGATPPGGATEHWDATISGNRSGVYTTSIGAAGASGTLTATGTSAISKCVSVALVEAETTYEGVRYRSQTNTGPSNVTSSISLTMPADIVAGDMLLAHMTLLADRTITTPAGWTLEATVATTGAMRVYSKVADGTEAGQTLTISFSGGSTTVSLAVSAWWSPEGYTLQIGQVATASASASATITFPSVTSTADGSALVMLTSKASTVQYLVDNGLDMWKRYDFGASSIRTSLFSEYLLAVGATGTRTAAPTSGTTSADMVSLLIERYVAPTVSRIYPSEGYYTVVYDGNDVTGYCRVADLLGVTAQLDATSLADDGPVEEPGATTWRVTLEGLLTKTIDDWLGIDALRPPATFRDLTITMGETGNATTYTWEGDTEVGAFVENYKVGPNVQFGEIPFRAELGTSGAPVRGTA